MSSLLDDARRLADQGEPTMDTAWRIEGTNMHGRAAPVYQLCHRNVGSEHAPDCPWRSMPRIVQALVLAEKYGISFEEIDGTLTLVSRRTRERTGA